MKELKEIAHRITQCDEVGVEGEKKVKCLSSICQLEQYLLHELCHVLYNPAGRIS